MASRKQYTLEFLLGAKTDPSYNSSLKNAENALTGISSTAKRAAGLITAAFAAVNITGAISSAVEEYADFEQELTNTAATAGATNTEYEQMEKAARDAGMATTKTASESAAALGYMALAGWDVNESTSALMPVLKLSEATNLDLARTSDLVTDSMGALKLEVSELPEYLDLVTKAQNSSNQTAEQLMEGYIRAGGAARSLGIDAKDAGIALGILANNGTKAGEGGRTLNAMLTRIAANKEAVKQMNALKISIFDAKGNFVGFEEALKRMIKGLDGLTMEEQAKALKNIAGTQYYTKMKYLLDGVKEDANGSASAWDDLDSKLSHAEGTLDEMDAKITGTMSGSMQIMNSALSDAKISFGDAFKTEIVEVIQDFTGLFNDISEGITSFADENELKIHQVFEDIKENVIGAGRFIGNFASGVVDNFDTIKTAAAGFFSMSMVSKASKQLKGISGVLENLTLGSISKGNLIAGGITLAAGAITAIGVHAHNTHKKLVQSDLEGHFGDISLSLEDIDELSQQIAGKKKLVKISEMLESIGKTDEAIENMASSMKSINKISWKVSAGFKLDIDEKESYKAEIQNYIQSAQDVIDNQGYSVSVATDILFGKNSKMSKKNDAFYAGLDAELGTLEKKLNKKISEAVENGVDIPTDKAVQKLLGKINSITTAITDAEEEASWQQLDLKYSGKKLDADTFKALSDDVKKNVKKANEGTDEAYNTEITNINARRNIKLTNLKEKHEKGKISDDTYKTRVAKAESTHDADVQKTNQAYYDAKAKTMLKSSKYLVNSITEAYPEVKTAMKKLDTELKAGFEEAVSGQGIQNGAMGRKLCEIVKDSLDNVEMSDTSRDALSEALEAGLGNIQADMEEFAEVIKNSGMEMPKGFGEGMKDTEALAAVSGSRDDALEYFGDIIGENDKWSAIVNTCNENGANIPEQIANGIDSNSSVVAFATENLLNMIENSLGSSINVQVSLDMANSAMQAGEGVYKSTIKEPVKATNSNSKGSPVKTNTSKPIKLVKNARGGIYSNPIFSILAEEGDEAVIPLNGSSRAKSLWQNAGKMLGMEPVEDMTLYNTTAITRDKQVYEDFKLITARQSQSSGSNAAGGNINITYSPQITIKGNADKKVVNDALSSNKAEIIKILDAYFDGKKRASFSKQISGGRHG
jgi:phage tail tape measure protein, TP901 family, core region